MSKGEAAREALDRLAKSGLGFEMNNHGTHVVIGDVDFWPRSGLWVCRRNPRRRFGVEDLINYVRKKGSS